MNVGHISIFEMLYAPKRFTEQVEVFEYLFEKLEPQNAKRKDFPLKSELELMLQQFPYVLRRYRYPLSEIAERMKELRRKIVHGYTYYYTFGDDMEIKMCITVMDHLIKCMNLRLAGFDGEEIAEFEREIIV